MGLVRSEVVDGEPDEVVAIPGHQTAAAVRRTVELLPVRKTRRAHLVSADGIDSSGPRQFRDLRAQILVEIEPHPRGGTSAG